MLSQPIGVERLQLFCHHLFYKILGDTLDLNEFFNGKKNFYETTAKLSFEKKLAKLGYNEEISQELDKVAFKIFDFAFCSTNEKQIEGNKKLFLQKSKTKSFVQKYLDQKNNNNIHTMQSA